MVKLLNSFPTSQSGWIKVLDLEGFRGLTKRHIKNICNKIFQLKYLSLRNIDLPELPKEIKELQYLETLDIRETKITSFPKSIVLPKLAHLLAGGHIEPPNKDSHGSPAESFSKFHIPREIGSMTNMQILSHVKVSTSTDEDTLKKVAQLNQLRKIIVVIDGKKANLLLPVIEMLNECLCSLSICISDDEVAHLAPRSASFLPPSSLVSLNINGKIGGLPSWIEKLEQLCEITLCRTSLAEDRNIMIMGNLVNLPFIRLGDGSYTKIHLTFKKGFTKLELLIIEGTYISHINFEEKAAPKLEKIVWTSNCKMENLGIDKLPSLKEIELSGHYDISKSIEESVKANPNFPLLKKKPARHEDAPTADANAMSAV